MDLKITLSRDADRASAHVSGEIDVSNASELRDALNEALAEGPKTLEVDFADVPYIDSTGIGVVVGASHRAQEAGCELVLVSPQANVSRVLGLLGVDQELTIR